MQNKKRTYISFEQVLTFSSQTNVGVLRERHIKKEGAVTELSRMVLLLDQVFDGVSWRQRSEMKDKNRKHVFMAWQNLSLINTNVIPQSTGNFKAWTQKFKEHQGLRYICFLLQMCGMVWSQSKKRFGLKLSKYELEFPLRRVGTLIRKTKKKKANKKR